MPRIIQRFFPLILLTVCWLVYSNTMHRQFMIDDHFIYTRSHLGEKNILGYFIPGSQQASGVQYGNETPTYRPLTKMIWTMTYRWFGADPVGYHIFNVFVFWLTCSALFYFLSAWTGRPFLAASAALVFCVHPFQGIMMNNLPTILVSFEMMLMFLSMLSLKYAIENTSQRFGWYALSYAAVVSSFLIHETAAAFPIYLFCALIFGLGYPLTKALKAAGPFFLLSLGYVLLRLKFTALKTGLLEQAQFFDLSLLEYLATFAKLIAWYCQQLISPMGVVMIWTTPIVRSDPWIFVLGLCGFLALIFLIFIKSKNNLFRWGISWLVIGFAPVTLACLFRLGDGLCLETLWVNFSSIGYFLILGHLFERIWEHQRTLALAGLCFLVLGLAWTSRIYNRIWSDEKRYCYYALEMSPSYRSGYFWLGNAFMREGNYNLARQYLPMGLSSIVYNRQIFNNLGIMDFDEGKWQSAEQNFLSAVQENPNHPLAYTYLARIALQREDELAAHTFFLKAVALDPWNTVARLGLAAIESKAGQKENVLKYYQDNLRIAAHDGDTLLALLRFYVSERSESEIRKTAEEIFSFNNDSVLLIAAGEVLAQAQYAQLSYKMFEKALSANPKDKRVYLSFGKLMGNLNRFDDAIRLWQQGALLDPNDPQFNMLISQANSLKAQGANN